MVLRFLCSLDHRHPRGYVHTFFIYRLTRYQAGPHPSVAHFKQQRAFPVPISASHFEQRGGLCPHPHHSLGVYQSYFWAETPTYVKYVKSRPGNESFIQDELVTSTILLNSNDLHVYPLLLSLFLFRTDNISRNASFDSLLQVCF